MRILQHKLPRILKPMINIAMGIIICWALVLVIAQIKPFWIDEWRLLYNLKFKSAAALFGPLEYTQQFPRVYLVLLKAFTSAFDYSYFTLRFPAFITGVCSIWLAYRLMNRIYSPDQQLRFLFLLIVVSSPPFLSYLVQIKQYEMEIFLSLVGLWQLLSLSEICNNGVKDYDRYTYLCLSFLVAPFFSYTYPIVAAPIFLLVLIQMIHLKRSSMLLPDIKRRIMLLGAPLLIGALSIAAFYVIDVSHVMQDTSMQCFWRDKMLRGSNNDPFTFLHSIWDLFGAAGSGYVFQIVFSVLGILAIFTAYAKAGSIFLGSDSPAAMARHYAVLLISLVIVLFIAGMLPLGEARLNAFTLPAIAILIIHLLQQARFTRAIKLSAAVTLILYLGLIGNIGTSVVNSFFNANYSKTVRIYNATEDAIIYAQAKRLPLIVTPDVTFPYDLVSEDPCLAPIDAVSVLKTFPVYKEKEKVPVFIANDIKDIRHLQLPEGIKHAEVGDGLKYRIIIKPEGK